MHGRDGERASMDGRDGPTVAGRRVLVTGGGGFIGSHVADALVDDNDVRVLDDFSSGHRANVPDEATAIAGDVRDPATLAAAMDGVDLVFHEAAVVSVERSLEAPLSTHETNATATLRLLERAREADARVVLASSCAIYGDPPRVPIAESTPPNPTTPYGASKASLDRYARLYHDRYGLETVALRYFNVYGPRQRGGDYSGVIDVFREQARAGDPLTVHGDGTQTRDFVHVGDVVRANRLAATTDAVGTAFNVGTGDATRIVDLARLVRDLEDADVPIEHTDPRPGDIEASVADTTDARERLGFEAEVSLADGLATL